VPIKVKAAKRRERQRWICSGLEASGLGADADV
jgi:hypothetical protein